MAARALVAAPSISASEPPQRCHASWRDTLHLHMGTLLSPSGAASANALSFRPRNMFRATCCGSVARPTGGMTGGHAIAMTHEPCCA
jgi:hypothetical protein